MNVVLIGFMGCGKSSVAPVLGERVGFEAIEMDLWVARRLGVATAREAFERWGELQFREMEIEVARKFAKERGLVIAAGGGVVQNKIILDLFKEGGARIFFLKAPFALLAKRLEGDFSRPLFRSVEEASQLYLFREPLYHAYADEIIEVGGCSIEEIALSIEERLATASALDDIF